MVCMCKYYYSGWIIALFCIFAGVTYAKRNKTFFSFVALNSWFELNYFRSSRLVQFPQASPDRTLWNQLSLNTPTEPHLPPNRATLIPAHQVRTALRGSYPDSTFSPEPGVPRADELAHSSVIILHVYHISYLHFLVIRSRREAKI